MFVLFKANILTVPTVGGLGLVFLEMLVFFKANIPTVPTTGGLG